jgi:cardiolipin synthase
MGNLLKDPQGVMLVLTYANQLTILRMIFIPCFVLLIVYGYPRGAMLVFILAGLTDLLDGIIARKLQQKTVLGSFLDPMADKLLITAAFITLSIPSLPLALHIPVWFAITSISRDLLIALASLIIHLQTQHSDFPPTMLGKLTTTTQLITVGVVLLANLSYGFSSLIFQPVVYTALALTIVSGLHYFYRSVRIIESYQKADASDEN